MQLCPQWDDMNQKVELWQEGDNGHELSRQWQEAVEVVRDLRLSTCIHIL